jgi:hypothetical protein
MSDSTLKKPMTYHEILARLPKGTILFGPESKPAEISWPIRDLSPKYQATIDFRELMEILDTEGQVNAVTALRGLSKKRKRGLSKYYAA